MDIVYVVSNESRAIHESGQVGFGPSPDPTCRRQVEGGGTRNELLALIGRVDFGFGSVRSVESRWILQTSPESSKNLSEFAKTH